MHDWYTFVLVQGCFQRLILSEERAHSEILTLQRQGHWGAKAVSGPSLFFWLAAAWVKDRRIALQSANTSKACRYRRNKEKHWIRSKASTVQASRWTKSRPGVTAMPPMRSTGQISGHLQPGSGKNHEFQKAERKRERERHQNGTAIYCSSTDCRLRTLL